MEGNAIFKQMVENKTNELFCNTEIHTYRECKQLAHAMTRKWIRVLTEILLYHHSTDDERMSRSVACRNGQGRKFYL